MTVLDSITKSDDSTAQSDESTQAAIAADSKAKSDLETAKADKRSLAGVLKVVGEVCVVKDDGSVVTYDSPDGENVHPSYPKNAATTLAPDVEVTPGDAALAPVV